jgi:hypothetical protein
MDKDRTTLKTAGFCPPLQTDGRLLERALRGLSEGLIGLRGVFRSESPTASLYKVEEGAVVEFRVRIPGHSWFIPRLEPIEMGKGTDQHFKLKIG